MPAQNTRATLARQWTLLRLLPHRGSGLTARELTAQLKSAGHPVTKRQVERDLTELATLFPIECMDASTPWGWRWLPQADARLPGLDKAEAMSLIAIEQLLRPLVPEALLQPLTARFSHAARLMEALPPAQRTRAADAVRIVQPGQPLLPARINEEVLTRVQNALLSGMQIDVEYASLAEPAGNRTLRLHPLGLVHRGPASYLVATAFDYEDIRMYAVHRIAEAHPLEEAAMRPTTFDLDRWLAEGGAGFGSGETIDLELRVSAQLATYLVETPLSGDQTLVPDGDGFMLKAHVQDTWQLRWWLLSQGDQIEVCAPQILRQSVLDRLTCALNIYRSSEDPKTAAPAKPQATTRTTERNP
jgi:predicted DNA-binding transcriptional regulator YafY